LATASDDCAAIATAPVSRARPSFFGATSRAAILRRRSGYGRELLGPGIKEVVNHKLVDVVDIDAEFCPPTADSLHGGANDTAMQRTARNGAHH
jgi:hypothetical protein